MELPCVDAAEARRAVARSPMAAQALRNHVAAVATDGRRELWSPNFLQALGVLRTRWDFGEEIRLEEWELLRLRPDARFAAEPRRRRSTKAERPRLPVPPELAERLWEFGRPPSPPPLPDRLPCKAVYKQVQPWTRFLWEPEVGPVLPQKLEPVAAQALFSAPSGELPGEEEREEQEQEEQEEQEQAEAEAPRPARRSRGFGSGLFRRSRGPKGAPRG